DGGPAGRDRARHVHDGAGGPVRHRLGGRPGRGRRLRGAVLVDGGGPGRRRGRHDHGERRRGGEARRQQGVAGADGDLGRRPGVVQGQGRGTARLTTALTPGG